MRSLCLLLISLVSLAPTTLGQIDPSPKTKNTQQKAALQNQHVRAAKDYQQFVPYWTTEGSWHSELQLRNNLKGQDLTVSSCNPRSGRH